MVFKGLLWPPALSTYNWQLLRQVPSALLWEMPVEAETYRNLESASQGDGTVKFSPQSSENL